MLALLGGQDVRAAAPEWSVNPADFERSAILTATLFADFEQVAGPDSRVAAFSGDEVRGVAAPIEVLGEWMFFLTVYANTSGETLRFRAYIAAEDAVAEAQETLVFQANRTSGDPSNPFELHTVLDFDFPPVIRGLVDQTIELGEVFAPIVLDDHLESEDGDPVSWSVSGPDFARPRLSVQISADNVVSIDPPAQGWTGAETLVFAAVEQTENRLTGLATARFTVRLPDRPPEVGAIPDQTIHQFRTFESFDLDDYLSEYDGDEVGWDLVFPTSDPGETSPAWSVNIAEYELAMSATVAVSASGRTPLEGAHRLAAFVREEGQPGELGAVRGVAAPVQVAGRQLYFLTIYANEIGEEIVFRFYDAEVGRVYPVKESLSFAANAMHGDPQAPLVLQAGYLSYALDEENVVRVEILAPEWTGSEAVRFVATDQGTVQVGADSEEVFFTVELAKTVLGDVTGDEQVTEQDATWIMQHVVSTRVLSAFEVGVADVNGDGRLSPFDARLVQQYAAGVIVQFPVQSGSASP